MNVRHLHGIIAGGAVAAALFLGTWSAGAQDVVELRIRGRYFTEPATVSITVTVEPDAANRALRIEADGERLFRSTQMELDGENARRLHTIQFKNLPAGHYVVRARVLSRGDVRGLAEDLLVVGDPGSD